jgi:hypothetical protein
MTCKPALTVIFALATPGVFTGCADSDGAPTAKISALSDGDTGSPIKLDDHGALDHNRLQQVIAYIDSSARVLCVVDDT